MKANVYKHCLNRIQVVFGEPKSSDHKAFYREYTIVLEQFTADELEDGTSTIIATQKFSAWPTVAEIEAACREARGQRERTQGTPEGGTPGTGWRVSDSGRRWYQIERSSPEFAAWMRFYRDNGRTRFADGIESAGRTWVLGSSPTEHGAAMLAHLDNNLPKRLRDEASS